MNKRSLPLLLFFLVSISAQARGGGSTDVGNGGMSIECASSPSFRSYDYFVTQHEMRNSFTVNLTLTPAESLQRIRALIATKLPAFAASFDEFVGQIQNTDPSKHYLWIKTDELKPIDFDALIDDFHRYGIDPCPSGYGSDDLVQVIVRETQPTPQGSQVIFHYDTHNYSHTTGVQRSFLLVHEWLWNFTDSIASNRRADWLLHSAWFDGVSSEDAIKKLKEIGIQYP